MVKMVIIDKAASIYSRCRATTWRKGRLLPVGGIDASEFMLMLQGHILSPVLTCL